MARTELVVILDRSGSMASAASDHIGGLKTFVRDQQNLTEEAYLTFIQFDSVNPCEVVFDHVPIAQVDLKKIELVPRGATPLLDALGRGVAFADKYMSGDRIVIFMVVTDGEENSSIEWTKERIKRLIADKESIGWKFLYLGANVDAFVEATRIGISVQTAANYSNTRIGIQSMYAGTSRNVREVRTASAANVPYSDALQSLTYTDEQRAGMADEANR